MEKNSNELNVMLNFGNQSYLVGQLAFIKNTNRYHFKYDEGFLTRNLDISPIQLPIENKTFRGPSRLDDALHGLHGVFADSLPDSWGMRVQDFYFNLNGIQNPTSLDRLAFVGKHGIGALQYEPSMRINDYGKEIVSLATMRKSAIGIIKGEAKDVSDHLLKNGGSAGGMRPKFTVQYYKESNQFSYGEKDLDKKAIPCIVKVPTEENVKKEYQQIEYVYSLMARNANIQIPQTYLIEDRGNYYFVIKRFDINDDFSRNHTHTLAGMEGVDFGDNTTLNYNRAFKITQALVKSKSDQAELFRRMCFNVLGYNCDDHGKNFSFLMNSKGQWQLSPAYDMTYSRSQFDLHQMSINGKHTDHTIEDFKKVAEDFSIKNWKEILSEVKESLSRWKELASNYNISNQRIMSIQQLLDKQSSGLMTMATKI